MSSDDDLTDDQSRHIEATLQRALDEPMPPELKTRIKALIEPHTINMQIKHGDVMQCIRVAFPVIRDWLRDNDGGSNP
ncbi:hypothetical protein ACFXG4_04120 [Nocardia sp. NPDC059246]|uniref:hypothetical protein n=1 Tax=unclassified Nocardia TaxID=2637762 RepID=UPI0036935CAE